MNQRDVKCCFYGGVILYILHLRFTHREMSQKWADLEHFNVDETVISKRLMVIF